MTWSISMYGKPSTVRADIMRVADALSVANRQIQMGDDQARSVSVSLSGHSGDLGGSLNVGVTITPNPEPVAAVAVDEATKEEAVDVAK